MTTITVGTNKQFTTIATAVAASHSGDVIQVDAGTYTNDFTHITQSLTLQAVGGMVTMNATVQPYDGKAILTEGNAGIDVSIDGFAFTGAVVGDGNGAGIRYEGGNLTITNSHFYNNEDGILGAADPNGNITISHSEFDHNGVGAAGNTHNMYIGDINSFTLTDSFTHDAIVGHEIKSRAENNTITNNRILDNDSTSSYEIDIPNGGNTVISGNVIEQGAQSQNSNIIAYGEEGSLHAGTALSVTNNKIINDKSSGPALWNASSLTNATFANNSVYGFNGALVVGAASQSGTVVLTGRPVLDQSAPYSVSPVSVPPVVPPVIPVATEPPVVVPPITVPPITVPPVIVPPVVISPPVVATPSNGLTLNIAEDAWNGDAQYTVSVDGTQVGGVRTASASHAAGQSDQVSLGTLSAGVHDVSISFINDAYNGTADTDRNLYLAGATNNGQAVSGSTASLLSNGAISFKTVSNDATTPSTSTLTLNMSEDAYQGNAQFAVSVDGKQMGGTYTSTALHAAGQTEAFVISGIAETFSPHDIAITFLNDKYDGTPANDRNLYIDSVQFDRGAVSGGSNITMLSAGTQHLTAVAPEGWAG
jgi:hypothetical protein